MFAGKILENENMAKYTTFKIGGNARFFYSAKNKKDLIFAIKNAKKIGMPFYILGCGSNILVSDDGFDGLIIRYCREGKSDDIAAGIFVKNIDNAAKNDVEIFAEANIFLSDIVAFSADLGLSGLEWAAGIPGTIGAAICGNAGAYKKEISDVIESVEILEINSFTNKRIKNGDCQFRYRSSIFKNNSNIVVLSAQINLKYKSKDYVQERVKQILEKRKKSLGICYPSAGCIFKNPRVNDGDLIKMFEKERGVKAMNNKISAGYLIEKLGLKGEKIGGAVVSANNANFILNAGNAKLADVIKLINRIKELVFKNFNVVLEEEIKYLGS